MLTNSIYDFIVLAVGSLIVRATKNAQLWEQAHASAMTVHNQQQLCLSESASPTPTLFPPQGNSIWDVLCSRHQAWLYLHKSSA